MDLIYPKSHIECRDSVLDGQINEQNSKTALGMNLGFECKIDDKFRVHGGTLKQTQFSNTSSRLCYVNILPQFRTYVSLFESVICLVTGELWNFQEARMLYDKCIEN